MKLLSVVRHSKMAMLGSMVLQLVGCTLPTHQDGKGDHALSILAMGDSITEGGPDHHSYLFPLDSLLRVAGYHPQFTGPRFAVENGDTLHHAGFSGRTAEFLAAHADSIYAAYPADIVLLHAGHNHFQEERPLAGIIRAQREIIQTVKARNPGAFIFVAAVVTSGKLPKYSYIPALDTAIQNMVQSFRDTTIVCVDQREHWNWEQHTIADKVHPNTEGAHVIARNWSDAIIHLLKKK